MYGIKWERPYWVPIFSFLCNVLFCLSFFLATGTDTTLCDKVCQWLATDQWFSPSTLVSSANKTDLHDITGILLKVALNTINQTEIVFHGWQIFLTWVHKGHRILRWKLSEWWCGVDTKIRLTYKYYLFIINDLFLIL
jgi:hypothetical protein